MPTPASQKKVESHTYLDQQWDELSDYARYVPLEFMGWEVVKKSFNDVVRDGDTFGPTNSFKIRLVKDGNEKVLRLYGFDSQESPLIAYCKDEEQEKNIAIIWTINSYFAFGQHWNELTEYMGFIPRDYETWESLKEMFDITERYSPENPFPLNIIKDGITEGVNLYGFKQSENYPSYHVALCKSPRTGKYIAILMGQTGKSIIKYYDLQKILEIMGLLSIPDSDVLYAEFLVLEAEKKHISKTEIQEISIETLYLVLVKYSQENIDVLEELFNRYKNLDYEIKEK